MLRRENAEAIYSNLEAMVDLVRDGEAVIVTRTFSKIFGLAGLRIGYANFEGDWEIAAFGRNITDEVTVDGALNFLNLTAFVNEPAYWGVEFRWNFAD